MKKSMILIILAIAVMSFGAFAADQNVSVTFETIDVLGVTGAAAVMFVATTPGVLPVNQTDNSTSLAWTTNSDDRKITASLATLFAGVNLSALVTVVGGAGTAAIVNFAVAGTPYDAVTGIGIECLAGQLITYTGVVTVMVVGYGSKTNVVTWTLTGDV